jgi:hypothetical protein
MPLGAVCVAMVDVMLKEMLAKKRRIQYVSGAVKAFDNTCANGRRLHMTRFFRGERGFMSLARAAVQKVRSRMPLSD